MTGTDNPVDRRRQEAVSLVREAVWRMRGTADLQSLSQRLETSLRELGIPFDDYSINVREATPQGGRFFAYTRTAEGQLRRALNEEEATLVESFWRGNRPVYRPDLQAEDPHGEIGRLGVWGIRAVLDVPFSHGTVAISSGEPFAFNQADVEIIGELTQVLSEGFRRLDDLRALEERNRALEQEVSDRIQAERALADEQARRETEAAVRLRIASMDQPEDLQEVVREVSVQLKRLGVAHDSVSLQVVNPEGTDFFSVGIRESDARKWSELLKGAAASKIPFSRLYPWVLEVWRTGCPHYQPSCPSDADELHGRSVLDVPFSHGTLAINNLKADAFGEEAIALVGRFAQVLSAGFRRFLDILERQRVEAVIRADLAVQRLRNEVLQMQDEGDWERVANVFDQVLRPLVDFDACGINIVDRVHGGFTAYGIEAGRMYVRGASDVIPPALAQAMESGRSVYRRNQAEMAALSDHQREERHSVVDAPFLGGTIALSSAQENAFTAEDIAVLERLAGAMSQGYRRAHDLRMIEQRNRELQREITERQQAEAELRRVQNLESLGLLAGGIAHDFNNVLTGITGNLELLLRLLPPGSDEHEIAQEATDAADRTRDLTRQLMTFAKGGSPVKETASIEDLIRETAGLSLRGSAIRPVYDLASGLWPAEIDRGQIAQVVQNLVLNAVQAMPEGGVLTLTARNASLTGQEGVPLPAGRYVQVTVTDQGVGIPPEHLGRIFDPYFTTKASGHGLGLSISSSIVSRHGGHLTARSQVGAGTTFDLYLPAAETRPAAEPETHSRPVRGSGRILLMDDDEMVRQTLSRLLASLGYEVDGVPDGVEAMAAYQRAADESRPYRLVIMDLTIPGGMGGKEAAARILAVDPRARLIVSSGYSQDPVLADYAGYGFRGRLSKPIGLTELAATVRQVLAESEASPG